MAIVIDASWFLPGETSPAGDLVLDKFATPMATFPDTSHPARKKLLPAA